MIPPLTNQANNHSETGVGLILIAISSIALRITINTYKSNSEGALGPLRTSASRHANSTLPTNSLGRGLNATGGLLANFSNHHQHLSRPHGHRTPQQLLVGQQQQQQQALINERLYMMAAAAANSSMHRPAMGPASRPGSSQASHGNQGDGSMLSCIKQRIPRCLSRLISNSTSNNEQQSSDLGQSQVTIEQPAPASGHQPSENNQQQAQGGGTLATLLQQYRMLPAHHQASLWFAPNGLVPPLLAPAPMHLLAAAAASGSPTGFGAHLHDPIFRPPPPSYSAAMQDQRMRMIMQERASLQQLQQNTAGALTRQPVGGPPPPPPSISESSGEQISQLSRKQKAPS